MTKKVEQGTTIKRITWLIWLGLLVLVILLGSAFSRAWEMNQTLQAQVATLAPMLTAVMEEKATLQARLDYVQSDAYVDEWSRVHAGMTQPGETLVVVVAPTPTLTPRPTALPLPTPTPAPLPFWQRWWRALTGNR